MSPVPQELMGIGLPCAMGRHEDCKADCRCTCHEEKAVVEEREEPKVFISVNDHGTIINITLEREYPWATYSDNIIPFFGRTFVPWVVRRKVRKLKRQWAKDQQDGVDPQTRMFESAMKGLD